MSPHPAVPILRTARLVLRPLELSDAADVQEMFPHWEVVRHLSSSVPWPYPPDGAVSYFRDVALPAMAQGREWHWTLRPTAAAGQLVGMISLMDRIDDNRGFWLNPDWQGRGLMSEASEAATDFWFDGLGRPVLRVPKASANVASRHISERQGMRLIRTEMRDYVAGRLPADLWEITADEWRRRPHRSDPPASERGSDA